MATIKTQFPLKEIDQNSDKSAEHWFEHYSVEIQKIGNDKIPLLNRDTVKKHELIRFRGIISNQLNNEYFQKLSQFRESDDIKQSDSNHNPINKQIMQRSPMVINTEPNQTDWCKSVLLGNNNKQKPIQTIIGKFYCHTKLLKICDSIEIYGIWSPKNNSIEQKEQEEKSNTNNKENDTQKDLYSDTPNKYDALSTIHVLYYKKIDWCNPMISTSNGLNNLDKLFSFYYENSSLIRASLIKYISQNFVMGDHLLSEYILLNLISKTVSNKNGISIGYFPLNIRGEFNNYKIRELYNILRPFTLNINLTIHYLNAKRFDPIKNNETDELEIGILQFRENTAIVIDETLLNQGNLNQIGLQNLDSLKTLINQQKVFYDFQFHTIPFNVNASIVILSKTKPLPQIQSYCYIYSDDYTQKNDENNNGHNNDENDEQFTLEQYRIYLSLATHLMDKFELNSKDVCKEIEQDFVNLRKEENDTNENTLHHRLLLMRLINASFLNQTDDNDMMHILKYMQILENKRKVRNDKFKKIKVDKKNTKETSLNKIDEE